MAGGPDSSTRDGTAVAPARLLQRPGEFGRVVDAMWTSPPTVSAASIVRSYHHHLVACAVNDEMAERCWSVSDVAEAVGLPADQLRRKLSGQRGLAFEDAAKLALLFGIQVLPEPATREELLPDGLRHLANDL